MHHAAYLVVAHERVGKQLPFAFLEKVRAEFQEKHAESSRTLHAHSLDKTFGCAPLSRLAPTRTRKTRIVRCLGCM